MIQLDEKAYFYLLGILPVLLLIYLAYQWWRKRAQRKFADPNLLRQLAPDRSFFKPQVKMVLFLLALVFLTVGLVNPKMGTKLETVKRQGVDIVFAVDVSGAEVCYSNEASATPIARRSR